MAKTRKTKALREAAKSTAIALIGGKPAIAIRAVMDVYRGRQDRRVAMLCAEILRDAGNAHELADQINKAVLTDGDDAGEAFVAAARAAVEAVDPAAVVSIALLARHFLTFGKPARREFRAYLDWFEALDAAEYGALRNAVAALRGGRGDPIKTQVIFTTLPAPTMTWYLLPPSGQGGEGEIATGPLALTIYTGFQSVLEARGVPDAKSIGDIPVAREVVDLLTEVVPASG